MSSIPGKEDTNTKSSYEVIIEPTKSWFYIDWHGIWNYRDMLRFLVIRDFISKYKQTILGPAWFIIQPLFMTLVFTVIFGNVAQLSTDGLPKPLFYLCGQLGWLYFATCFQATSTNLLTNANLYKKVYFPRVIVPTSIVVSNLLAFFIQLITFMLFWLYYKLFTDASSTFSLHWTAVLMPLLLIQTAAFSLGIGLWMNALTAKYRDLQHMSTFLIQAWLYITPVIYPMSEVPEKFRWLVHLNPMSAIVESYRGMFLGTATIEPIYIFQSAFISFAALLTGLVIFNRIQRNFVDYS